MKKLFFYLVLAVTTAYSQPTAKMDTLSVLCGLKIDDAVLSNRYEKFKPQRCDTCKSFHTKESLVYLKSPLVLCYGNGDPYVRQFDMGIYQIVLPVSISNDSNLTSFYVKTYGKFKQADTVVSGIAYKRIIWNSTKRRLEVLKSASRYMVVLTDVTVQNEFLAEYLERELFSKRDDEAKSKLVTVPKNGNGKNTFTYSLAYLEGLIKSCNTTSLTNVLGDWNLSTDPFQTQVSWSLNEKTNRREIPTFQLHYTATVKDKPYKLWLKIPKNISEFAYALEVSAEMNGSDYALLKQSLIKSGYLLNEPLTLSLRKEIWENKTKPYSVSLSYHNGSAYMEIINNTLYKKSFPKT